MSLPDIYEQRIDEANKNIVNDSRNCIGTSLFLLGMKEVDEYIDATNVYSSLEPLKEPQVGCLVVFMTNDKKIHRLDGTLLTVEESMEEYGGDFTAGLRVIHMGVVISLDPIKVTHRDERGFYIGQPLEEVSYFSDENEISYFKSKNT